MLTRVYGHTMKDIVRQWPNRAPGIFTDPLDYVNQQDWQELAHQRDAAEDVKNHLYSLTPEEQIMLMQFIILSKEEENV